MIYSYKRPNIAIETVARVTLGVMVEGDTEKCVSLWTTAIPHLGMIAQHHWFVILDNGQQSRWEVWQSPNVISNGVGESWDHLHKDLMPPEQGVRHGPAYKLHEWDGELAAYLAERIVKSPESYPWCGKYRYWPGPNSNTYVQWVLLGKHELGRKGLGKQYCRLAPGVNAFEGLV